MAMLSPPRDYKTAFWWAKMAYIYKTDLVSFCMEERVRILFGDEVAEIQRKWVETSVVADKVDEPDPIERGIADYKRLAEIFDVEPNADQNLAWFKNQCSNNLNRNKLFKDALVKNGRPGGQAAQFSIILIVAALMDHKNVRAGIKRSDHLRRRIEKYTPELLDEFDDKFSTVHE